jgi:hypothetical protein
MLKKIVLLAASAISAFALHMAEVNINKKDLEVSVKFDIAQFYDIIEPNTMFVGAKFFNPDKSQSSDLDPYSIDPYLEADFFIIREIGNKGMSLGMGIKINNLAINDEDFITLPLGVSLAYPLPFDLVPMSITGLLFYAPESLCISPNADGYLEYKIHYDAELVENANVTLGYRNIKPSFSNYLGSLKYNSSWYFGYRVRF